MKISGVDIRPGNILEHEGGIWKVAKIQHTQPGKGGAYHAGRDEEPRGRPQDQRPLSAAPIRWRSVRLDTKDFQFLFAEGDDLTSSWTRTPTNRSRSPRSCWAMRAAFLQDGMQVNAGTVGRTADLGPAARQIEATIVEADAVVKGQTASSSYKPAILDNGVRVMVPPHIGSGTRIVVDVYEPGICRQGRLDRTL
jgi:elongation factor P